MAGGGRCVHITASCTGVAVSVHSALCDTAAADEVPVLHDFTQPIRDHASVVPSTAGRWLLLGPPCTDSEASPLFEQLTDYMLPSVLRYIMRKRLYKEVQVQVH